MTNKELKIFILLPTTLWHKSILPLTLNENRSKIAITAESREEADILFNGLSAGGSIEVPISDSPWGSYFGMFRDKYGIEWTVDFNSKNSEQTGK